ncbi:VC_2705 family sodium/solute symporter [Polynucleobacter sp. MWH-Loch1C5]|uniref:VC_2705 family sodium/solute symporter n=1 Tax=Polynucleobacter sp. MWH-Loch1C5 TaxID=2689108 RepID=UPI001C0E68E5|nr:VC_2705 family sodium/solute symporter [Polynucleobacter sp. MWH-Loch1C5]MBU3541895.1 VC_2705 family sodium/solute symporter [Polynucleobacter sp. MWH-Loch1C5]
MKIRSDSKQVASYYLLFAGGFLFFVYLMGLLEVQNGPGLWLGYVFLFVTIAVYASIGLICRTSDMTEYYVAGRRIPAVFNGMATAADWMSAATFIGLVGILFSSGYKALAFIVGWTGGFCLVAMLIAPYIRRFGTFTIPDFLAIRYGQGVEGGSAMVRLVAVAITILCSFVYLVAQIQGVGLIVTRFIGVEFGIGVFFGLAGILVCSFLGGMRAVTWTQVAQYIILIIALLLPLSMISLKKHDHVLPQLHYGKLLEEINYHETDYAVTAEEQKVRDFYTKRAQELKKRIDQLPDSYFKQKQLLEKELQDAREKQLSLREIKQIEKKLNAYPKDPADAYDAWEQERKEALLRGQKAAPSMTPPPSWQADDKAGGIDQLNFVLLIFCLMFGTASLPHILTRFFTTTSVAAARYSVFWTLFFVAIFYLSVPALAVMVKLDLFKNLVGISYADLPTWVLNWRKLEPIAIVLNDVNGDGFVQWAEISISPDMVILAAPEITGLPYVISGLVAAGALAAALSTADGLLLTISNSISNDVYYHLMGRKATHQQRVTSAKIILLAVALFAAYVTSLRPGDILFLVGAAFSLAASSFFAVLIMAVYSKTINKWGAIAGMVTGVMISGTYIALNYPFVSRITGVFGDRWFGVDPIASGAFGIPASFIAAYVVSKLTAKNPPVIDKLVDYLRTAR